MNSARGSRARNNLDCSGYYDDLTENKQFILWDKSKVNPISINLIGWISFVVCREDPDLNILIKGELPLV